MNIYSVGGSEQESTILLQLNEMFWRKVRFIVCHVNALTTNLYQNWRMMQVKYVCSWDDLSASHPIPGHTYQSSTTMTILIFSQISFWTTTKTLSIITFHFIFHPGSPAKYRNSALVRSSFLKFVTMIIIIVWIKLLTILPGVQRDNVLPLLLFLRSAAACQLYQPFLLLYSLFSSFLAPQVL